MKHILTIGNFDGIHQGHRKLLRILLETARQQDLIPVVITYSSHPAYTLNPHPQPLVLMPPEVRNRKLRELGIPEIETIAFTQEFAKTTADEFLHNYLMPKFDPRVIVVGFDSHFGYRREGNFSFLQSHSKAYSYDLIYVQPELCGTQPISSSMIRSLLREGKIREANRLLTEPYSLYGTVTHGRGAGRSLGFPTANLKPDDPCQLIPATGIYLSEVCLGRDRYFGLTNIGYSPTLVTDGNLEIETYILDFDQDIYDRPLTVRLLDYLRAEESFPSREELINAMRKDLATARAGIRSLI